MNKKKTKTTTKTMMTPNKTKTLMTKQTMNNARIMRPLTVDRRAQSAPHSKQSICARTHLAVGKTVCPHARERWIGFCEQVPGFG